MKIELRGITVFKHQGRKYVDLLVREGRPDNYVQHRMGVDLALNRGKIITFLGGVYSMPPGQIVWPRHIEVP